MMIKMRKYSLPVLVVLFGIMVAGCKIGPKYSRPEMVKEKSFRFANADTLSIADLEWISLFRDTTLHRLVNTALKNSPDMKIAFARISAAEANLKIKRGDQWPMLGAGASGGWTRQPMVSGTGNLEYSSVQIVGSLSWEIDLWGKLRSAKEAARAQLIAQQAYGQSVRLVMIFQVVNSYFNLLEFDNELKITRENISSREKSLELVKAKLIAGTASGLTVAQAEAELAIAKSQIPRLEMATAMEEDFMTTLLGEAPHAILRSRPMLDQVNTPKINSAGLPSQLIVRRPDIIMAEQSLVAANANIGVARAMMLPSLSISGYYGAAFNPTTYVYNAMGNLVGPIFQGGKLRANVKLAEAQKEEMLATYQKTILNSMKEVSDALVQVNKMHEVVQSEEVTVKAAKTAYDLSDQLYNAGYASYLDVINAQSTLFQSQINLSRAQSDELTAWISLYSALGGGWK